MLNRLQQESNCHPLVALLSGWRSIQYAFTCVHQVWLILYCDVAIYCGIICNVFFYFRLIDLFFHFRHKVALLCVVTILSLIWLRSAKSTWKCNLFPKLKWLSFLFADAFNLWSCFDSYFRDESNHNPLKFILFICNTAFVTRHFDVYTITYYICNNCLLTIRKQICCLNLYKFFIKN